MKNPRAQMDERKTCAHLLLSQICIKSLVLHMHAYLIKYKWVNLCYLLTHLTLQTLMLVAP